MAAWVAETDKIAAAGKNLIDQANSNDKRLNDYLVIMNGLTNDQWNGQSAEAARAKVQQSSKLAHKTLVEELRTDGAVPDRSIQCLWRVVDIATCSRQHQQ